jgi:hypothetical protein
MPISLTSLFYFYKLKWLVEELLYHQRHHSFVSIIIIFILKMKDLVAIFVIPFYGKRNERSDSSKKFLLRPNTRALKMNIGKAMIPMTNHA